MTLPTFTAVHIVPDGRDMLACSCLVPDGWVQVPIPEESYDLDNPAVFVPVLVCMAPYGTVLFTIAARPAFSDGSVQDWAEYLAGLNNLEVERMQEARIQRMPCVLCDATMPSDAGTMRSRSVFLEDGGRLYNIGTMAPEAIWPSVEPTFRRLLGAFKPDEQRGISATLMREMTSAPVVDLSAEIPVAESPASAPAPAVAEAPATDDREEEPASAPSDNDRPTQPADVALADDNSALDPEHPINARLRNNGVGLVPRVIMVSDPHKFASVGAGAIESVFRVPFGWHVIDDGRRTLVFDAGGRMQINLDLRHATPEEHIALLEAIGDSLASENPKALFLRTMLMDQPCLAVRDLLINGETLDQTYLVRPSHRPDMALVCRVTAKREDMVFAMNTLEVIVMSLQGPPAEEPKAEGAPTWWATAVRLEQEDRLEDAEQVIQDALDHIGVYSQLAYLHELRYARLLADGRTELAEAARQRAIHWLHAYAGSATSGGEGAALSLERDQRIAALGGEGARP